MQIIGAVLAVFALLALFMDNVLVAAVLFGFCCVVVGMDYVATKLLKQLQAMEQALHLTAQNTGRAAESLSVAEVARQDYGLLPNNNP